MSHRNNASIMFIGFAAGAGALIALLTAPQSGKRTRKMFRRKYEGAHNAVEDLSNRASDWIDKGSEWADKAKRKMA
jgi:gas vesicle protein